MSPPLVLLHAFPLHAGMWAAQREAMTPQVICPDQRGFGSARLLAGDLPSVDTLADDVADLLDAQGINEPIALGGLSMGGYVAMAFWRRHRSRVAALILADTKAGADGPEAAADRERIATEVEAAGSSAQLVSMLPKLLGTTTREQRPDVVAEVSAMIEAADPHAVAWAQRAMAGRPDSFSDLALVDVPALVIVGAQDALSPPTEARAMADAMPGARLVELPGAGHLSALETPEAFTAAVRDFLRGLPAAR